MSVVIYSKNNCVQCKMSKQFMDKNDIAYTEYNVNGEGNEWMVNMLKGKGIRQLPAVFNDEEFVTYGFAPNKLEKLK